MPDETELADRVVALVGELGIPLTRWQTQLLRELYAVGPDGRFKHHPLTGPDRGELAKQALTGDAAFYVERGATHCHRCGDTNYDERTLICLTCTYPNDPCSKGYWETRPTVG